MVPNIRPAAQAQQASSSTPTTSAPVPANAPAQAPSAQAPASNGRIPGIDGLLDQVAAAAMRQAAPLIKNDILPAIQADPNLQKNIGEGIGQGLGKHLSAPAWVAAGAISILAILAVVHVVRSYPRRESAPTKHPEKRSSKRSSRRSSP